MEKREGRMTEVWIARSALSAKINLIGGARTEMGPLPRMMVSDDLVTGNDCEIMQSNPPNGQEEVYLSIDD